MHHNRITRLVRVSVNFLIVLVIIFSMSFGEVQSAAAEVSPTLFVNVPTGNFGSGVFGDNWPLGASVAISIDDPGTGVGTDYSDTQTAQVADWDPDATFVEFNLNGFVTGPGQVVTMTDGTTTKTHTVTNLTITEVSVTANTVTGTADAGTDVVVRAVCDQNGCIHRYMTADINGQWEVDFSVPGPGGNEQNTFDLFPGQDLQAMEFDADDDITVFKWHIPNPRILARANEDRLEGNDWIVGSTVSIEIDDPLTEQDPDKTINVTVETAPWNPNEPWFEANFNDYDLKAGDIVTATDGSNTKQLIIQNLLITDFDLDTDQVYGTADPSQLVYIQACGGPVCPIRDEIADQDGNWVANFAIPGEESWEQNLADITGGMWIDSNINDEDGDMSRFGIGVPESRFHVQMVQNDVQGYDWEVGIPVTLTIDDPDNGVGIDFSDTQSVIPDSGGSTLGSVPFEYLGEIHLAPGMFVTMSNGDVTKTHTITNLMVTSVDVSADTVSGTGTPGANVNVQYCDESSGCAWRRWATIQPDGSWSVDFSVVGPGSAEQEILDILSTTPGEAIESDGDGDHTDYAWFDPPLEPPSIVARLTLNQVDASGWPAGTLLTIIIDDPSTGSSPDYTDTATSQLNDPQDPGAGTSINFFFGTNYTLKSGDIVTVSGGDATRMTIVADIHVTDVDVENDIVSGTAGAGITSVNVRLWGIPFEMQRDAVVVNGVWSADFSVPSQNFGIYDIKPGDQGVARWFEGDGDFTTDYWRVPNPTFAAYVNAEFIEGYEWPLGAIVALEVDDPTTQANPDYTDSTTVAATDWDPNQTWFNFELSSYDLKTGDDVTLSGGSFTKQLTLVDLAITEVDLAGDIVHGAADPDQAVSISVCGTDFCIFRDVMADSSGNWSANFAEPSPGNGPEDTIDIRSGIWINAFIWDEDGDNTSFGFTAEAPQCQPGDSISGTVFEHDGVTPVQSANIQVEDFNTGEILYTTLTDQNGQFGCSLPNDNYRAMATRDNYSREYFDQANDTNAAQLTITAGTQLTDINFTLSRLATVEHLTFNLENPLLQELSVRQAIVLGTNRQEILNEAFLPNGNFGMLSNSIVPPEHWASAPASELTLYPYDPTQAEAILDAAGWINRDADIYRENAGGTELAFTFKTTNASLRVAAAELFRQYMEQIGIHVTVETIPASEFFGETGTVATRDFDIAEFAWGGGYDDETFLEPYITDHVANHSGYSNLAFDAVMASAAAASTEAEKLTYYYEAQTILSEDLPVIPYFTRYDVAPVTTDIGNNVTVSPESYLDIHFDEVTDSGVTTVLQTNINPDDLPPNFQLLGQVYDIGTSASFTSAQACFSYDDTGLTQTQEDAIRLYHLENNAWVDVTDNGNPDTVTNMVCGTVSSFSPFVVMYPSSMPDTTPPTISWIGNINDGDSFYFGFVPAQPTCTADDPSGIDGACTVSGYSTIRGSHTLTATATDNAGNTASETRDYTVLAWTVLGFYQPVDMNGVYNIVKNGSTVPLKFEIFAGTTELTDPDYFKSLTYVQITCNSIAATDEVETTVTNGTGLRYDSTSGQFIYNWKTPKISGACYRLTLITDDGSTLVAYFRLK